MKAGRQDYSMLSPRRALTLSLLHSPASWLASAAFVLSILIIRLPLEYSLGLLVGTGLLAASAWEPAIGLSLAISLGPAKAYLAAARPDLPADWGQIFFAFAAAGWLARGALNRKIIIPYVGLFLPLGLYIGVGLFSLLPALSIEEGLKEALKWIEIAVGMVILITEMERGRVRWIIGGILVAGLIQAAIGVWQFEFREKGPEAFRILGTHYRAYGTFEQPNPYGGFLGLIWPLAAGLAIESMKEAGRRKPASLLLASSSFLLASSFMLASLYFSFSRGAWLGAAAAGLAMAVALPRRWPVGVGLALAAFGAGFVLLRAGLIPASIANRLAEAADFVAVTDVRGANINDLNFAIVERLAHWQAAQAMAQAKPWLGVGLGNYAAAYPQFRLFNWENALGHAHMIYLNVLAETGVLGLMTYVILWGSIIALTIRATSRTTGTARGLALGLLGAWTHLSLHQIVDNLYVNNIHFLIAGLLALLTYASRPPKDTARV